MLAVRACRVNFFIYLSYIKAQNKHSFPTKEEWKQEGKIIYRPNQHWKPAAETPNLIPPASCFSLGLVSLSGHPKVLTYPCPGVSTVISAYSSRFHEIPLSASMQRNWSCHSLPGLGNFLELWLHPLEPLTLLWSTPVKQTSWASEFFFQLKM